MGKGFGGSSVRAIYDVTSARRLEVRRGAVETGEKYRKACRRSILDALAFAGAFFLDLHRRLDTWRARLRSQVQAGCQLRYKVVTKYQTPACVELTSCSIAARTRFPLLGPAASGTSGHVSIERLRLRSAPLPDQRGSYCTEAMAAVLQSTADFLVGPGYHGEPPSEPFVIFEAT